MPVSFFEVPDLTEEFVNQFHELKKQLASNDGLTKSVTQTVSVEESAKLKAEFDKRLQEKEAEFETRLNSLSSQRDEAIKKRDAVQQERDDAKNRIDELDRLVEKRRTPPSVSPNPTVVPDKDSETLKLQVQELEEQKNNWMRQFERCNDELEKLKRDKLR